MEFLAFRAVIVEYLVEFLKPYCLPVLGAKRKKSGQGLMVSVNLMRLNVNFVTLENKGLNIDSIRNLKNKLIITHSARFCAWNCSEIG